MAIADITLLSGFHALRADLEKVWLVSWEPCSAPVALQAPSPALCRARAVSVTLPFSVADLPL